MVIHQDDSNGLRMSLENDRWQNIKREYKIFRRPRGQNSEHNDVLAVAMPPNTSTLEMLCNVVLMNAIPDGTQGTYIRAESGQLRFFVGMMWGCSDSAEIQPRKPES
jgi:hypothetical protein